MNPIELIGKLSPAERMDMMMKGFRPGNINDVKRYRAGEQLSLKEKAEKFQAIAGTQNLGGANEREITLDGSRPSIPLEEVESLMPPVKQNYRQQINEDLNDYSGSVGKTFNTDDILSLHQTRQNPQKQSKNLQMVANEGFNNAKEYLNAFVLNLQNDNPAQSYQLRVNIYKALKKCLETEGTYKGNAQSLNAYRTGVLKAEQALMNKLQGGVQ
jgi:hypothetical protein